MIKIKKIKTSGKTIRNIIIIVFVVTFCVSFGVILKNWLWDYYRQILEKSEIQKISHGSDGETMKERFSKLLSINSDIKGWIYIPNTKIDYPVLQNISDPKFYLSHNYKKESSKYGSIFIDSRCKLGTSSQNIVLHGHHMRDGEMFADILKFDDIDFYKQNPTFFFYTPEWEKEYKIISVFKTNTLPEQGEIFDYQISDFSETTFNDFISQVKKRSLLDIPVTADFGDGLITMSTCSYEFDNFRTVVVARKVRDGESGEVDVNQAQKAKNPLMPVCWYKKHGGNIPT